MTLVRFLSFANNGKVAYYVIRLKSFLKGKTMWKIIVYPIVFVVTVLGVVFFLVKDVLRGEKI